ncbi:MAG: hypothetical protein KC516_04375 [Nanoarchaeota archaeon]|nr:hypothetical protein [Nanoarchaeota archaeon]
MKTLVKISLIVSAVSFMVSFSLYFSVYSSGVGTNGYYEDPTDLKFTHKYLNPEGSINSGVSLDLSEKIALPGL